MKHFLLVGNFGVGNVGDEAIRAYILQAYPEIHWTVLSGRQMKPGDVPRLPYGIRSFLSTAWWRTLRAYRSCDGVVFGGGSLFTDIESPKAIAIWKLHARVARLFGKPYYLAFQGIGPFLSQATERVVRNICAEAVFLSVRDPLSLERTVAWHMNKNSIQTFDPVFSLLQKERMSDRSQKILIVIPRLNSNATLRIAVEKRLQEEQFDAVHLVLMEPDHPEEKRIASELASALPIPTQIKPAHSLPALIDALLLGTAAISQRYHGALSAAAVGLPVTIIPQADGDKLSVLAELLRTHDKTALLALVKTGEEELRRALLS